MSDFDSGNSVNCVLLDVNLYNYMKQRGKNNWSPKPGGSKMKSKNPSCLSIK